MKIYSGVSIGGQLLFLWENQKDKRTLMKVPAFHIQAIEFQFGEKINWNVGIGFGSKGIVNVGIVLPLRLPGLSFFIVYFYRVLSCIKHICDENSF